MRLATLSIAALLAVSACAPAAPSCEGDLVMEGCACASLGYEGPCRYESACDGGRGCRVLVCRAGRWTPLDCIDCCGELDAGPPNDAALPSCAYTLPSLDFTSSTSDPMPITVEGGAPLADAMLTVVEVSLAAGSARLGVTAGGQTRTFVVPAAHAGPTVHVGDSVRATFVDDPELGRTQLVVSDSLGRVVDGYERDRTAFPSWNARDAASDFLRTLTDSTTNWSIDVDCRNPGAGTCGQSETAYAVFSSSPRMGAAQGASVVVYGVRSAFEIAVDALADDQVYLLGESCSAPTHAVVALEAHGLGTWLDAGTIDAGP